MSHPNYKNQLATLTQSETWNDSSLMTKRALSLPNSFPTLLTDILFYLLYGLSDNNDTTNSSLNGVTKNIVRLYIAATMHDWDLVRNILLFNTMGPLDMVQDADYHYHLKLTSVPGRGTCARVEIPELAVLERVTA